MKNQSQYGEELNYRAGYLISGFIKKELTDEEKKELDQWILASEANMIIFEELTDDNAMDDFLKWYSERNTEDSLKAVKRRIRFKKPSRVVSFMRYAAAACLLGLIGYSIYFFSRNDSPPPKVVEAHHDILPGSQRAVLKLGKDKVVFLDGVRDSVISEKVQIKNGAIVYASAHDEVTMHEISIPRKGYYKLILPDGSRVWLNSESSIKYPSSFAGDTREVEVTGESFFEVAKDPSKPFIVSVNGIKVQALGTVFNINAYTNEPFFSTTLVEGSIRVSKHDKVQVLQPNQQINITDDNWKVKDVDVGPAIAWTKNKFKLKNTTIEEVMRMVERWYDARIIYEDNPGFHFNGSISRDLPVSDLLKLLEETGHVHFVIDGNIITVKE